MLLNHLILATRPLNVFAQRLTKLRVRFLIWKVYMVVVVLSFTSLFGLIKMGNSSLNIAV